MRDRQTIRGKCRGVRCKMPSAAKRLGRRGEASCPSGSRARLPLQEEALDVILLDGDLHQSGGALVRISP